jgi:hypothetical protein
MFVNSTVFVLGAGASWHYGYPTGEGLVESVISMADRFSSYCKHRLQSGQTVQIVPKYVEQRIVVSKGVHEAKTGWQSVQKECELLCDRLKAVRPLLIDNFLAWNESLRPIGKLMIAAVILECEAIWLRERANQNHRVTTPNAPIANRQIYRDDWYRFIVHKLVYGCRESTELLKNDVHFITFNYDTSLEYHLNKALTSIDLLRSADVEQFLGYNRIIHVYGSVHRPDIQGPGLLWLPPVDEHAIDLNAAESLGRPFASPLNHADEFSPRKTFLDLCLGASANLRTIDPHDKEEDQESLTRAREWIADAGLVYILGYGFDRNNNRRVGIEPLLSNSPKHSGKSVMFTNFRDINTINKSASHLFYGDYESFTGERQSIHGDPLTGNYVEKSVRTIYEALEKDFYALEGELIATTKI